MLIAYWEWVVIEFCPGIILPHTGVFYCVVYNCGIASALHRCPVPVWEDLVVINGTMLLCRWSKTFLINLNCCILFPTNSYFCVCVCLCSLDERPEEWIIKLLILKNCIAVCFYFMTVILYDHQLSSLQCLICWSLRIDSVYKGLWWWFCCWNKSFKWRIKVKKRIKFFVFSWWYHEKTVTALLVESAVN